MADAEVRVFAPDDPKTPVETGRTDAQGKFTFPADRDGFWSAEARGADQVARVMIKVGDQASTPGRLSPAIVLGVLAALVVVAFWYRVVRSRRAKPSRGRGRGTS